LVRSPLALDWAARVLVVGEMFAVQQRAGLRGNTAVVVSGFYASAVQPRLLNQIIGCLPTQVGTLCSYYAKGVREFQPRVASTLAV
jgi:hypothetical protein